MAIGNEGFITEMDIRRVLRDFPEANNLLDDYEFDDEEIRTAMTLAVDEWNDMTPTIVNYTVDNFPYRSMHVRATIAYLLQIAARAFASSRGSLRPSAKGRAVTGRSR